jgi:hypothetical protein
MKKVLQTGCLLILLLLVFAGGFSLGRSMGFETGSEWALVQADILAREAGVFMPVYLEENSFRVVIRQPRGLYKRAWQLADQHDGPQERVKMAQAEVPDKKDAEDSTPSKYAF